MDDLLDSEKVAVEEIYEEASEIRLHFADIPAAVRDPIVQRVHERRMLIEQHVVHDMLIGRLSEGRYFPRRHMQFAFLMLGVAAGLLAIVVMIASLFGRH